MLWHTARGYGCTFSGRHCVASAKGLDVHAWVSGFGRENFLVVAIMETWKCLACSLTHRSGSQANSVGIPASVSYSAAGNAGWSQAVGRTFPAPWLASQKGNRNHQILRYCALWERGVLITKHCVVGEADSLGSLTNNDCIYMCYGFEISYCLIEAD